MAKYESDRSFTDYVHKYLAIPKIYDPLGWRIKPVDTDILKRIDLNSGIDYVLQDRQGNTLYIQERFREKKYAGYNDATLRFRRENNPLPERVKSEFYKIRANYLVYGISNGQKSQEQRQTLTDFIKWVILDIKFIQNKYKEGKIRIIPNSKRKTCWDKNGILHCPENFNPDNSSSFLPFDIKLIEKLWGRRPIIAQKGFLENRDS